MRKFIITRRKNEYAFIKPLVLFLCLGFTNSAKAWNPMIDTIWTITDSGGRVDWSHSGNNLIAFDKPDSGNYYDVFTMNPDGSNLICLTCNNPQLPRKHTGNPAWHPSGNYIVFQAEKADHPDGSAWSKPGWGRWNDLWIMTSDGDSVWQLTNLDTSQVTGVLHPRFSHDGSKLLWSEDLVSSDEYALKVADFVIDTNGPHLNSIVTYQPGDPHNLYESHGWSNNDSLIIFSGNLQTDQHWTGLDVYWFNIYTHQLIPLTSTMVEWDEHAHPHPDGNKIVWMSSNGYDFNPITCKDLKCDYWLMNADSSDKIRLTYFNELGQPEYTGDRVVASDCSWSPEGNELIAYVQCIDSVSGIHKGKIMMIKFTEYSIEEKEIIHPESFYLFQNYPNPFIQKTVIRYSLNENRNDCTINDLRLTIHDITGRLVKAFPITQSPDNPIAKVIWDAKNDLGESVSSGIYFYKLKVGDKFSRTPKLLLLR